MPSAAACAATALARLPVEAQARTSKPSSRARCCRDGHDAVLEGVRRVGGVVLDPDLAQARGARRGGRPGSAACSRRAGPRGRRRASRRRAARRRAAGSRRSARCSAGPAWMRRRGAAGSPVEPRVVVGDLERTEAALADVARVQRVLGLALSALQGCGSHQKNLRCVRGGGSVLSRRGTPATSVRNWHLSRCHEPFRVVAGVSSGQSLHPSGCVQLCGDAVYTCLVRSRAAA